MCVSVRVCVWPNGGRKILLLLNFEGVVGPLGDHHNNNFERASRLSRYHFQCFGRRVKCVMVSESFEHFLYTETDTNGSCCMG